MGMDAQAVITVGAAVMALTQLIKWSPIPTAGYRPVVIVFILSGLGVLLWALSFEPTFDRRWLFNYFSAWVAVATSSAGVFGLAQVNHTNVSGNAADGEPAAPDTVRG